MGVSSLKSGRERDLRFHLEKAAGLDPQRAEDVRRLARQLDRVAVLPMLGAGASFDCGMRLASELAGEMYGNYIRHRPKRALPEKHEGWNEDLGRVADAIALTANQRTAVNALGLNDHTQWPGRKQVRPHFCGYHVLARMAREGMLQEAISFNYDCGFEAALGQEGFQLGSSAASGGEWLDHTTVVVDHATHCEPQRRGAFVLNKVHGCAEHYRRVLARNKPKSKPWEAIVLRWSQLLDWRTDFWARDVLADRARRNVLLLIGFSAQDPVIHVALTRVLEELYRANRTDVPRVVVLDTMPQSLSLKMLIKAGCSYQKPPADAVTHIKADEKERLTAVIVALFVEMLVQRLTPALRGEGTGVPKGQEQRLALLMVSTPIALRWSYLLGRPDPRREEGQRINLEQAADRGYVPMTAVPHAAARSVRLRRELREKVGLGAYESIGEAIDNFGFVVANSWGRAYLPTGMSVKELERIDRPALLRVREALPRPPGLDAVLVAQGQVGRVGVSLASGATVTVP